MDTPEIKHGDGHWTNQFEGSEENWDKKRLNRIKFPHFGKKSLNGQRTSVVNGDYSQIGPSVDLNTQTKTTQSTCDYSKVLEFLECPICMDTLVQASIYHCGHMYCYRCIMEWTSENNWCPICQQILGFWRSGEPTRVYAVDALIESLWGQLSPHIRELIIQAKAKRMDKLESQKNAFWPKVYHRIRIIRLYFGTKGFWRGLTFPLIRWWKNNLSFDFLSILKYWIGPVGLLMIGCLVCSGTCGYLSLPYMIFDFFAYIIHCIWMYPGWSRDLITLTSCGD